MWYIDVSKCQHNFLEKSVEANPVQFPSVILTISVFIYNFFVEGLRSFENNVRCCSRPVCAVPHS